jgi:hypothetical protein
VNNTPTQSDGVVGADGRAVNVLFLSSVNAEYSCHMPWITTDEVPFLVYMCVRLQVTAPSFQLMHRA